MVVPTIDLIITLALKFADHDYPRVESNFDHRCYRGYWSMINLLNHLKPYQEVTLLPKDFPLFIQPHQSHFHLNAPLKPLLNFSCTQS